MIAFRLILLLVVVILGAYATEMLIKVLIPLIPIIAVVLLVALIFGGWLSWMRRF